MTTVISGLNGSAVSAARHKAGAAADIEKVLTGSGRRAYYDAVRGQAIATANAVREAAQLEYDAIMEEAKGPFGRWGEAARSARQLRKAGDHVANCFEAAASGCAANMTLWRRIFGAMVKTDKKPKYEPNK